MSMQAFFNKQSLGMIPKTTAYIDSLESRNRQGHHNSVALRYICNAQTPMCNMSKTELEEFDDWIVSQLKKFDTAHL